MIKAHLTNNPSFFNMDFEKAAMNAATLVFKCEIHGCNFHFSQNGFRRVQHHGLVKLWFKDAFRMTFKKVQALAYLPPKDVLKGFNIIEKESPKAFQPVLTWLENNYIGKLKKNSRTERVEPRFPIKIWNLHERVKKGLPTTNNGVEVWHNAFAVIFL